MSRLYETLQEINTPATTQATPIQEDFVVDQTKDFSFTLQKKYHNLFLKIGVDQFTSGHPVIEFLSSSKGEGVTTIVHDFGKFLADKLNQLVLILETNRSSYSYKKTQVTPTIVGWDEVIANDKPLWSGVKQVGKSRLYISKPKFTNTNDIIYITPNQLKTFVDKIRPAFDIILVDSPPIWSDEKSIELSGICDGSILVVEANRTKSAMVKRSVEYLQTNRNKLLGTVLNKREYPIPNWLYKRI